jgi:predicted  nucleic acid-binding Zn-ribbon protein
LGYVLGIDDVERLKQDVREGRIPADRLVELVVRLQRELQAARRRINDLEKKLGGSATAKFAEPFSLRSEELYNELMRLMLERTTVHVRHGGAGPDAPR